MTSYLSQSNSPDTAKRYIADVLAKRLTVCKWVRLFCRRHMNDLQHGSERGLYFDEKAGARILRFFDFLRHSIGEYAGKPFVLSAWQQAYLWVLFGWKRADGLRRFRISYLEVARKNGKSSMASGIALYLLEGDGEQGAEIYSAATKRDQAKIVHGEAVRMVRASKALSSHITLRSDNMFDLKTNSKFEPLSSDYNSLDGLNIHGAIVDELHAHKTRDLWDVLETATGARRQPLIFAITTAGVSRQSICREQHDYLEKVLDGSVEDDSYCGIIFTLDDSDAYEDDRVWVKANPNLGISAKYEDLQKKLIKAKEMPSALNAFLRLHMNVWTQAENRWIDPDAWALCSGQTEIEHLRDEPCFGGLDLSSTTDLTALVLKFPRTGDVLCWFWIPEDNIVLRERRDRVPFSAWVRGGYVETTPGNVIDYEYIKDRIRKVSKEFRGLKELGYDPYMATQIAIQLEEEGYNVVPVRQGWVTMSPALKQLEKEYLGKELKHGDNPVLKWMAANLVVKQDSAGNYTPDKAHSIDRIDGIVALCVALSRQMNARDVASIYESRGLLTI